MYSTVVDLNKTFIVASAHTSIGMVAKTKEAFDIFSSKYSAFKDKPVPSGSGVLKGIASVYNGRYQISFAKVSDWEGLTGERFYTSPTFALYTTEKEVPEKGVIYRVTGRQRELGGD
jgi:hypothetical protein